LIASAFTSMPGEKAKIKFIHLYKTCIKLLYLYVKYPIHDNTKNTFVFLRP
jgi:hypothetical protein